MNIHFTQQFPWNEPTYFIEKIWAGFATNDFLWNERNGCWSTEIFKENFPYDYDWHPVFMKAEPKLHTVREDKNNRWKAGKIIHFEQWTGIPYKSKCYHFAPLITCVSVQKIEIKYYYNDFGDNVTVHVDGRNLQESEILQLAKNDGFRGIADFFRWFNKDFTGKIIHWTDLNY